MLRTIGGCRCLTLLSLILPRSVILTCLRLILLTTTILRTYTAINRSRPRLLSRCLPRWLLLILIDLSMHDTASPRQFFHGALGHFSIQLLKLLSKLGTFLAMPVDKSHQHVKIAEKHALLQLICRSHWLLKMLFGENGRKTGCCG